MNEHNININVNFPGLTERLAELSHELRELKEGQKNIMATQDEEAAKLNAFADQLDKATTEIVAAVQALKDALAAAGNTNQAVDDATARLSTAAQKLDDLNPDATPAP